MTRRLGLVVPGRPRFDAARIEDVVASAAIEGDFLFCRDADFVFGAGNRQFVAGQQLELVVLRLHGDRALIGDQFDPQLAHEYAQTLADAEEQTLDHTEVGVAAGVEHQVVLRGQLQVLATGQGDALGRTEQDHLGLECFDLLALH
ncbi:hypothetical protein D3C76_1322380 [compost metagenome]